MEELAREGPALLAELFPGDSGLQGEEDEVDRPRPRPYRWVQQLYGLPGGAATDVDQRAAWAAAAASAPDFGAVAARITNRVRPTPLLAPHGWALSPLLAVACAAVAAGAASAARGEGLHGAAGAGGAAAEAGSPAQLGVDTDGRRRLALRGNRGVRLRRAGATPRPARGDLATFQRNVQLFWKTIIVAAQNLVCGPAHTLCHWILHTFSVNPPPHGR